MIDVRFVIAHSLWILGAAVETKLRVSGEGAFVRLACNPAVVPAALRPAIAWQYVEEWLALENVWIPEPGSGHAAILGGLNPLAA